MKYLYILKQCQGCLETFTVKVRVKKVPVNHGSDNTIPWPTVIEEREAGRNTVFSQGDVLPIDGKKMTEELAEILVKDGLASYSSPGQEERIRAIMEE